MPNTRSIISIEVQDEQFKKFTDLFAQYSAELDKQPEAWKALGEAMGESTKGLEGGAIGAKESLALAATQAAVVAEALRDAVKAQGSLHGATERSATSMGKLHKAASGIGGAIASIGGWMVRIAAFGGLGGLLSGLGIADLAGAAFSRSRAAGGLGLSTGQLASFNVNAQQFLGQDALRGAITAQSDVSKWGAFGALGIDVNKARNEDPVDLAFQALQKATERFSQDKKTGLPYGSDPILAMYQSLLGGNLDDVRRNAMNPGGAAAANRAYHRDIGALEIPRKEAQEWIELKKAMDRAGMTIETVFIDKLAPLAPSIELLATDFSKAIAAFASSGNAKFAIDELGKGLLWLGKYLGSSKFQTDIKNFESEIGWIANKLKWAVSTGDIDEKKKAHLRKESAKSWSDLGGAIGGAWDWTGDKLKAPQRTAWGLSLLNKLHAPYTPANIAFLNRWQGMENTSAGYNPLATTQPSRGATAFNSAGVRNYLTPQQGYDATIKTLKNGYYPDIVKGLMSGNPWKDKAIASELNTWGTGSGWYNAESKHWYKGKQQIAKGVFDAVIRTVDDDIKKYGKNWSSHLPKDVAAYVAGTNLSAKDKNSTNTAAIHKALKTVLTRRMPKPAHVSITNSTAARVAVSINAVAIA